MNKKLIYTISAIAMLIVAISIGFIFSQSVPPMMDMRSTNDSPQANNPNSVTRALEPIDDLIKQSAQGKKTPKNTIEEEKRTDPLSFLDRLTFSTKSTPEDITPKDITKEKSAPEKSDNIKVTKISEKQTQTDNPKANTAPAPTMSKQMAVNIPLESKQMPEAQKSALPKKKDVLITKSTMQPKADAPTIISTELTMDGDQVKFWIKGNNTVEVTSFILESPNRVVFDIEGTWAINIPKIISNRMVKDIRLGKTDTHTRIVFDLKVKPDDAKTQRIAKNEAQLTFK